MYNTPEAYGSGLTDIIESSKVDAVIAQAIS